MKKRIAALVVVICIMEILMPTVSRAAVVPYFMAVNDVLLPFGDDTMPYVSGGEIFVPPGMLYYADVWSIASVDLEWVRLYRGSGKLIDFHTASGVTLDQDGEVLPWPTARRIGGRFYIPLYPVCEFFGLTPEIIDIDRSIIPQEQMRVIRITSVNSVNGQTFVGLNRNAIRTAYNEYYAPPPPPPVSPSTVPSPGVTGGGGGSVPTVTPTPSEEPPPTYGDVTIYLSFYNISAGGYDVLLELIEANASSDYRFCFFVSANDIYEDPGLVRMVSGSGHIIGIWLEEGTIEEYIETSELLFEAVKIRTILVSSEDEPGAESSLSGCGGLIYWGASQSLMYDDTLSVEEVTDLLPTESGVRQNLMSSCSVNAALMLSGILSYLREFEYRVEGITETVAPPDLDAETTR